MLRMTAFGRAAWVLSLASCAALRPPEPVRTTVTVWAPPAPAEWAGAQTLARSSKSSARADAYLSMSPSACAQELARRGVSHRHLPAIAGVEQPVMLLGPLSGVTFSERQTENDILDCRLAVALDDFAQILSKQGIAKIQHLSMYRRGAVIAGSHTPSQHSRGLAIDIASLVRRDALRLDVLHDWRGGHQSPVCPATPPADDTFAAAALRTVVCEGVTERMFHLVLTPNYNEAHKNHFHIELKAGAPAGEIL